MDAGGARVTFSYDPVGRLEGQEFSDDIRYTFTYDQVGNRQTMADATGTTSYEYDPVNRVSEVTHPLSQRVTYSYDPVGNRAGMIEPDGGLFTYSYDELNRTETIVNPADERTTFTYTFNGQIAYNDRYLANGMFVNDRYNQAGQHTVSVVYRTPPSLALLLDYDYDKVGNRTQVNQQCIGGSGTTNWTYDATYRLINEQRTGLGAHNTSHTYDPVGNRLVEEADGERTTFSYDAANQLTTSVDPSGAVTTYSYDGAGNLRQKEEMSGTSVVYGWNDDNRLKRVQSGEHPDEFKYNADGLLTERIFGDDSSIRSLWDFQNVLRQEETFPGIKTLYTLNPKTVRQPGQPASRQHQPLPPVRRAGLDSRAGRRRASRRRPVRLQGLWPAAVHLRQHGQPLPLGRPRGVPVRFGDQSVLRAGAAL